MIPNRRDRLVRTVFGLTVGIGLTGLIAAPAARVYAAGQARAQAITVDNELSTKNVRTEESNLANVVADAIRAVEKSDAAFIHASAFADSTIARGKSSLDDILKCIQYREDQVVVVKLTGEQIRKALENGLKLYPQKSPEFLQVSGLTVIIDPNGPKEKRITEVRIGSSKLDDAKKYMVAMPSPLANGALGYYKIWDKATAIDHETSKTVGGAVSDFLAGKTALSAKTEDRIVFKK